VIARRTAIAIALGIALAAASGERARAQDDADTTDTTAVDGAETDPDAPPEGVYGRVIVDRTTLRSGPGASFRAVRGATRGDVFPIVERGSRGYWFRVELGDGTHAWISGDAVYTHELSSTEAQRGAFLPDVFAPAALPHASGELAFQFGALGSFGNGVANGWMAIRPAILLAPEFGIEATAAVAVGEGGRLLIGTLGGIFNVFPSSPVVPFLGAGGGFAVSDPNADSFLLRSGITGAMYAGGGLRFGFRYRITIRIEARAWTFYDENRFVGQEELSAGATVFF
jgi:uncharacterized protein YgiM (DUF1202 family)